MWIYSDFYNFSKTLIMTETLRLSKLFDPHTLMSSVEIKGPVSSGLGFNNCSYPSVSLGHQEFHSLVRETNTDFS